MLNWKICEELVDLAEIFGNTYPVELEIGCGLGKFLLEESERRPQVNFLGLEIAEKVAEVAAQRCWLARSSANVRVAVADARRILPMLPPERLAAIHVYFPDPWWKRRHRKRRIVADDVLVMMERNLQRGGILNLATDVQEYYSSMRKTLARFPSFTLTDERMSDVNLPALTHFEKKFHLVGKATWHIRYSFAGAQSIAIHNTVKEEQL